MTMNNTEIARCNKCAATFLSEDLVPSGGTDHSVGGWFCPRCGGADYDGVNEDGSINNHFW